MKKRTLLNYCGLLGIVILLIGLLMLLPQVWPVNLLERPSEGEEKAAASDSKET